MGAARSTDLHERRTHPGRLSGRWAAATSANQRRSSWSASEKAASGVGGSDTHRASIRSRACRYLAISVP